MEPRLCVDDGSFGRMMRPLLRPHLTDEAYDHLSANVLEHMKTLDMTRPPTDEELIVGLFLIAKTTRLLRDELECWVVYKRLFENREPISTATAD